MLLVSYTWKNRCAHASEPQQRVAQGPGFAACQCQTFLSLTSQMGPACVEYLTTRKFKF